MVIYICLATVQAHKCTQCFVFAADINFVTGDKANALFLPSLASAKVCDIQHTVPEPLNTGRGCAKADPLPQPQRVFVLVVLLIEG
jgi:hypothetical protein